MNVNSASVKDLRANLTRLPIDILQEIVDHITRDYWSVVATAKERDQCDRGLCTGSSEKLLGGEVHFENLLAWVERIHPSLGSLHTHHVPEEHIRNVRIAKLNGIDNHTNHGINDQYWNPWIVSLAETCRQLRSKIMDGIILRCLRINGLEEREITLALDVFGADRLQVTR